MTHIENITRALRELRSDCDRLRRRARDIESHVQHLCQHAGGRMTGEFVDSAGTTCSGLYCYECGKLLATLPMPTAAAVDGGG